MDVKVAVALTRAMLLVEEAAAAAARVHAAAAARVHAGMVVQILVLDLVIYMEEDRCDKVKEVVEYSHSVTLVLTQQCNLRCTYCYEHKNDTKMTFETAISILDLELSKNYEGILYIEFFGGEPFLEFDLIKRLYNYIDSKYGSKHWTVFITTNGTLVHREIQSWLKAHKRVICGLSLDGNKKMHDVNRSRSFDDIDLDFFALTYPKQHIKMTVSKESLHDLCDGIVFCHKNGFLISCNLAYGLDWSDPENAEVLEYQLYLLINYYLENPSVKPCSLLSYPIQHIAMEHAAEITHKWCGSGTHMSAYDTDGQKYPCHFFLPFSVGRDLAEKSNSLEFKSDIPVSELPCACRECLLMNICPTCYGSNFFATGNIYIKDVNMCKLMKIITKATSYFVACAWEKNQIKLTPYEENALLKSVVMIQEGLNL